MKTTDDCYTPPEVYDAILGWAMKEYDIPKSTKIIRPFYPGGDYINATYANECIVVDNPPFSILGEIIDFYNSQNIDYFLFAPGLTLFTYGERCNLVVADGRIVYENGANVNTSFVTNMGNFKILISPELHSVIDNAMNVRKKAEIEKYDYPPNVISAARLNRYIRAGVEIRISETECRFIRQLESQKKSGKSIFGAGFLISTRAANRIKDVEKSLCATEEKRKEWHLSESERRIIEEMDLCSDANRTIVVWKKSKPKIVKSEQMRMDI